MSAITPPTVPLNQTLNGDIQIIDSGNADLGTGSLYLQSSTSQLFSGGNTHLNKTYMSLNNGNFNIVGSNSISSSISGSTNFTSASTGNIFTTSVGTVTLSSTDGTSGSVNIANAGPGANGILINATNAASGQVNIQSAGASTTIPGVLLNTTSSVGGGISLASATNSTTVNAINIAASGTTNGNINVTAAGNFASSIPAIKLAATNTTSGQILVTSASNSTTANAIVISGTSSTGGAVNITSAGPGTSSGSVTISATNTTSGLINIAASGTSNSALTLNTPNGGITSTSSGPVSISTSNTASGISLATGTAGVPVTIGTATSVTTIVGSLNVLSNSGSYTQLASQNVTIQDNIITLNSGPAVLGMDAGLAICRGQAPGATIAGDVVTQGGPVQESGAFQTGSATPGTLVLSAFANATTNYYTGWFITITSGSGINQTRRIKTYNGTTKTATLYVTADNTTTPLFDDGLNLVTAPASGDTYRLWSETYQTATWSNTAGAFVYASSSVDPGQSAITKQQYSNVNSSKTTIYGKVYNNASFSASASVNIVVSLINNGMTIGDIVRISNSTDAGITAGVYPVTAVAANTFTFVAPTTITSVAASSLSVELLKGSAVYTNYLFPQDSYFSTTQIPGVFQTLSINLVKTSSGTGAGVSLGALGISGSYFIKITNTSGTGASATFAISSNGASTGSTNTITQVKGATNERLAIQWSSGATPLVYQSNAASSGSGSFTYSVIVY